MESPPVQPFGVVSAYVVNVLEVPAALTELGSVSVHVDTSVATMGYAKSVTEMIH
ncbi:hypothetical protein [Streptomyces paludis]|uniref:hypothetical protein n=1 Tax=Streptomyces paludis TaxID=2282738 RepID=UPI0013B36BC5|nr:hypothetical protein [Streptomyces paludis]